MAVWWITEQETWGMLHPPELCTKTGERLMKVLRTKHTDARPPTAASMESCTDHPPDIFLVDITDDTVTEVAGQISGGAGLGKGGLSDPSTLATEFLSGERGTAADFCGLRGVVEQ